MAELTFTSKHAVLVDVRRLARFSSPVPTLKIRLAGWPERSFSTTDRALSALVSKGLLSKPRRGYYLPTEENA